ARTATGSGQPLQATTRWRDGRWTVTLRRQLAARSNDEVALAVGAPRLFALAVWNGAVDRSPASKSITTWHVLELQP
ncbi:MAG: ethylbenzene dehydrogenase-related protein, partial [Planctomycetota bacterium]